MFADERKTKIADMLKERPSVTTSELMELFQVSVETIRRDLECMESQGQLKEIKNQRGENVLFRNEVYLNSLMPDTLAQYVSRRREQIRRPAQMRFVTPLTQKHEGVFLREFQETALIYAIYRRIYLLNCLEGREMERRCPFQTGLQISRQVVRPARVSRYSSTHDRKISLEGILGSLEIDPEDGLIPWLLAGELTHIGKNTSMGFGQYVVE